MKNDLSTLIPDGLKLVLQRVNSVGTAYAVGGCVRDAIMGIESKDIDIEVFDIEYAKLAEMLHSYGNVSLVGKSFGVIKFTKDAICVDFSLPRKDSKVSDSTDVRGRGISVTVDHSISLKEAAGRRDFTINALMFNTKTGDLLDFYDGLTDMHKRVLRATTLAFAEDPLRVLRGFQFAGRFGFAVENETAGLCKGLVNSSLVKEREGEEWYKFFTKSVRPSLGLQFLVDTGWILRYPDIARLMGVKQEYDWHPEGDVFQHTCHVMDALATFDEFRVANDDSKAALMSAALCHDFGKPAVTESKFDPNTGKTRIRSAGHAKISADIALSFLKQIGLKESIADKAAKLSEMHMVHCDFKAAINVARTMRKLNVAVHPATISELLAVIKADSAGRPPANPELSKETIDFFDYAKDGGFADGPLKPIIRGIDIIKVWNAAPRTKLLGDAILAAQDAYVDGRIHTPEDGVRVAMNYLRSKCALVSGTDLIVLCGLQPGPIFSDILQKLWVKQYTESITDKSKLISMVGDLV